MIKNFEAQLIEAGYTDEQERMQIILNTLQAEEARMTESVAADLKANEPDKVDQSANPQNDEL